MATYFVNKSGDDAHDTTEAQTPATGWLTIDKAANEVAIGDTVVVSPGTYRELVTMDTSGTNGSEIDFIADVDGSLAGLGAGLVVVSAFTDSNTANRESCLDPNHKDFFTWTGFVFQGGTNGVVYNIQAGDTCYEGVIFQDCVFVSGPDNLDAGFSVDMQAATTPTNDGLTIRRCFFTGPGVKISWDANEVADQNLKVTVENCLFVGGGGTSVAYSAFYWDLVSAGTFGSGGVDINNCTIIGYGDGIGVDHGTPTAAGLTVDVRNCWFRCGSNALEKQSSNDGALTSDYNTICGAQTNVSPGANDRVETSAVLLGGIADMPLYQKLGWSPYRPFAPMRPNSDDDWTSLIGDASATYAPADDFYGSPRPMHGTVDDRGAVEGRARAEQETTTVRTGSNAVRFEGAGYHDFLVPVAAQSTTITVYGYFDSNYTGTLPSMTVTNDAIMTEVTDTMTVAHSNWEQLTSGAFTPTAAGVCRVRLQSSDTSADGKAFFDDLVVT